MSIEFYRSSFEAKVNKDFSTQQREETARFLVETVSIAEKAGVFKIDPSVNFEVIQQICQDKDFTLHIQE